MQDIPTVYISAIIAAITSLIIVALQGLFTTRAKIDESLRQDRLPVYKELWEKTGFLPKQPKIVTCKDLSDFVVVMTDWYYQKGGIYLSSKSSHAFFKTRDKILTICNSTGCSTAFDSTFIQNGHYREIFDSLSTLRTHLTKDLISRKAASRFF